MLNTKIINFELIISGTISAKDIKGSAFCEFYNDTMCAENEQECSGREECVLHDLEKRNHCYVLWTMNSTTKETIIKLKVGYLYNNTYHI